MPAATAITIAVRAPSRNIFIATPDLCSFLFVLVLDPGAREALRGLLSLALAVASGLVADLVAFAHFLELAFGALVGVTRCFAGLLLQGLFDLGRRVGTLACAHAFLPLRLSTSFVT